MEGPRFQDLFAIYLSKKADQSYLSSPVSIRGSGRLDHSVVMTEAWRRATLQGVARWFVMPATCSIENCVAGPCCNGAASA